MKLVRGRQIELDLTCIVESKKHNENKPIDTENELVFAREERVGG